LDGQGESKETTTMTDKQWEKFFELLGEIISSPKPGWTWQERREEVMSKATELDGEVALEEFCGWFVE